MKITGKISYIDSAQRSPLYPGESPFAMVLCSDGNKRKWWYDEIKIRPSANMEIIGIVNKFGNLCHVKIK